MDRREVFKGIIASSGLLSSGVGVGPGYAWASTAKVSARRAIRSLQISVLISLLANNPEATKRLALKLRDYESVDERWGTYPESFEIAIILFKLTPESNGEDWLEAARLVYETHQGFTGDIVENTRLLCRAAEGLLKAAMTGKAPRFQRRQSEIASYLAVWVATASGLDRVRWAKTAINWMKAHKEFEPEKWGSLGASMRYYAITVGISGDWLSAVKMYQKILEKPVNSPDWQFSGKGEVAGFNAFNQSRESFEAEAATAFAMVGRIDEAVVLLEKSRRLTPSLVGRNDPSPIDVLKAETALLGSSSVLAQVATTLTGTLVIVSSMGKNRLVRTTHLVPETGGFALPIRSTNSRAFHFKRDGLIPSYKKARKQKSDKLQSSLVAYVEEATRDAETYVGYPLRSALEKAKIPESAEVLIIQPAAVALLPISLASSPVSEPLGRARPLRYCDSLSSAKTAKVTSQAYSNAKPSLGAMALEPTAGGPMFSAFEQASISAIFRRLHADSAITNTPSKQTLQWPLDRGYWHVSSHASWSVGKPELSGIVLGKKQIATIGSIGTIRPPKPPRLVFLSCCETALINTKEQLDRYLSLPTAFLSIGCGGVIASHWPVSDAASALLSTRFYEEHLLEKKSPSIALQAAQRWISESTAAQLTQYVNSLATDDAEYRVQMGEMSGLLLQFDSSSQPFASPYFWGGFQLYGT